MTASTSRVSPNQKGTAKQPQRMPTSQRGRDVTSIEPSREQPAPGDSAVAIPHSAFVRPRAFELLATQPITLAGLSQAERDRIVVTAVVDKDGYEHPLSYFGDLQWEMAPEVEAKNRGPCEVLITWANDVPKSFLDDVKAVLYCALRRGRHSGHPWSGSSVCRTAKSAATLVSHLAGLGLSDFGEVRPLHLSDFIADRRRRLQSTTIRSYLEIIDLVWCFPLEVFHPLPVHPWVGKTLSDACGCYDEGGPSGLTGKTPVIPPSVQRALFSYCESRLDMAERLFQARDARQISDFSYELTDLRDCVLYLLQITSGMRNSESMSITNGCWRSEVKGGVPCHWVRTKEFKTKRGIVDFLVPPEALRALEFLQRYAQPLQARLVGEAIWLQELLDQGPDAAGNLRNGGPVALAVNRLNYVREIDQHMFLSLQTNQSDHLGTGSRVDVMSVGACNLQLKALVRAAGGEWNLTNHQCRRTFAYNVANSKLGRMGLVFLKWQLKHASMSWTQLYAANPYQDHNLYQEMEDQQLQARTELMEGWLRPDVPLAGGAGRKLMQTRAVPVKGMDELLRHTAEVVEIRSTGHAWCISGTRACRGQGVYDPPLCGGCSQAVIDGDQAPTWQMIHLDNLRLAAIDDCGPAVAQKAQRAIQRSQQVLQDLGVPLPTDEQARAYDAAGVLV